MATPEQPCLHPRHPGAAPSPHREKISPLERTTHSTQASLPFPSRPPRGLSPPCQPVKEGGARRGWGGSPRGCLPRPALRPSPAKRPAGWIPAAASCQPSWQTTLWKSKYCYHTDFLCPFLNKEGLNGLPESGLYRTGAMTINTRSHARLSDYSHRRYRVAWFQDKMQKTDPLYKGAFPTQKQASGIMQTGPREPKRRGSAAR